MLTETYFNLFGFLRDGRSKLFFESRFINMAVMSNNAKSLFCYKWKQVLVSGFDATGHPFLLMFFLGEK